ncbi:MAG TPA: thiosulfate oxidation carrier protein SoxY [Noviherbaspirillum sp.]|nr:thiosulfate oxidation carrier protein SoxY [Noviherbaspirillum sp.]
MKNPFARASASPRRTLLRRGVAAMLTLAGALLPLRSFARAHAAFDARSQQDAFDVLLAGRRPEKSGRIRIVTSELAENGAVVPITVETDLPRIESLSLLAPENPRPLAVVLRPGPRVAQPFTFRVKLAKTQDISVLVRSGEKDFIASRQVRVVVGGCIGT